MSAYEIVPTHPRHAGMLSRRMRAADRAEIEGLGYCDIRRTLRGLIRASSYSRSAFIDGEIAAMWGVSGSLLDATGRAWLLTGEAVEKMPLAFFRVARAESEVMLVGRRRIVSQIAFSYDRAIRFFRLLGYEIGKPLPAGPNGAYYCRITLEG